MNHQTPQDIRLVSGFLALAFGISWGGMVVLHFLDVELGSGVGRGVATVVFMGAPAIAAIAVLGLRRRSIRRGCGLYLGRLRWSLLAWIAPLGLVAAMVGVGLFLPNAALTSEYSAFFIELGFTHVEAAETIASLEATGVPLIVLLGGFGLLLGGTVFAVAALGEELGWRGLLLAELAPFGFWKVSLVTGFVWGIWHTPLILLGLQFPDEPVLGIVSMTAATVALSPIYTYVTVRARSVLAPTLLHGSFFLGVFTSVFLAGGEELVRSSFGVVGIVAAIIGVGACIFHDRFFAEERITTGEPLRPWSEL